MAWASGFLPRGTFSLVLSMSPVQHIALKSQVMQVMLQKGLAQRSSAELVQAPVTQEKTVGALSCPGSSLCWDFVWRLPLGLGPR